MTLARLTNYVDGNVLTGAQLNNEFDNILNNGPSLVSLNVPSLSIVQGLRGSLISNIGSFQANGYFLKSTTSITQSNATSSFSVNTQTAGPIANGRDQAAVFASTDVHFYAITTGGTSTSIAGICSSNPPPTGPTLPAGYTAWAYLASAKYVVATSVMRHNWNVGGSRIYNRGTAAPSASPAISTTSEAIILLSSVVPSVAMAVRLHVNMVVTATGVGGSAGVAVEVGTESSPASGNYERFLQIEGQASTAGGIITLWGMAVDLPIITNPVTLYGRVNSVTTGGTPNIINSVAQYSVPNGDVG